MICQGQGIAKVQSTSSGIEIVVIERRVEDIVTVVLQVGQFDTASDRFPAVEEEDSHGFSNIDSWRRKSLTMSRFSHASNS